MHLILPNKFLCDGVMLPVKVRDSSICLGKAGAFGNVWEYLLSSEELGALLVGSGVGMPVGLQSLEKTRLCHSVYSTVLRCTAPC